MRNFDNAGIKGGLYLKDLKLLKAALNYPTNWQARMQWMGWFDNAFALNLEMAHTKVCELSGDLENIRTARNKKPKEKAQDNTWRKKAQGAVYAFLAAFHMPPPIQRVREKLANWNLNRRVGPPTMCRRGTLAGRSEHCWRILMCLNSLVTPRVHGAVFSTIWGRWCTDVRYQKRHRSVGCRLGCGPDKEDSILHYSHCGVVRRMLRNKLNLDANTFGNLRSFVMTNAALDTKEKVTAIALAVYAVYSVTNRARHSDPLPEQVAYDALVQASGREPKGTPPHAGCSGPRGATPQRQPPYRRCLFFHTWGGRLDCAKSPSGEAARDPDTDGTWAPV